MELQTDADLQRRVVSLEASVREYRQQAKAGRAYVAQLEAEVAHCRDHIAHLETALESARRIGAAVGVLVAMRKLTYDDAFRLISQASNQQQRKLRDVADDLLETGVLEVNETRAHAKPV